MAANGLYEMEALCQYTAEDFSQLSSLRSTPLHYAVLGGNKEVVTYLLEKGALVNARNVYAESPLHWACKMGDASIVRLLLLHGASPNAIDSDGNTMLHWAAEYDHEEILLALLRVSLQCLFIRNSENQTAMQVAKNDNSQRAFCALLKASKR
jgi:ankyrin repeat protein